MAIILCKRQERNEGKRRAHEKKEGTKKGGAPKGAPPEKSGGSVTGWLKRRPVKREEPSKAAGPSIFSLKCFALHRTRGKTRLSAHFGPVGAVPFASRFTFFNGKTRYSPLGRSAGRKVARTSGVSLNLPVWPRLSSPVRSWKAMTSSSQRCNSPSEESSSRWRARG